MLLGGGSGRVASGARRTVLPVHGAGFDVLLVAGRGGTEAEC